MIKIVKFCKSEVCSYCDGSGVMPDGEICLVCSGEGLIEE